MCDSHRKTEGAMMFNPCSRSRLQRQARAGRAFSSVAVGIQFGSTGKAKRFASGTKAADSSAKQASCNQCRGNPLALPRRRVQPLG